MSAKFYDSIEQAVTDILQEIDGDISSVHFGLVNPIRLLTQSIDALPKRRSVVYIFTVPYRSINPKPTAISKPDFLSLLWNGFLAIIPIWIMSRT